MNVNYDKVDDLNAKVVIVLDENDYAGKVKDALKEIAKTRTEPGFRPGHVPMGMIQKKYGKAVKFDVINKLVSDRLFDYIKEENLPVLGQPVPTRNENLDIDAKELSFEFTLALAPEFNVKVDKDVHVPYYNITVSDEMINEQDTMLRRRMGKQQPGETVDDDALVKGVITELNPDGSVKEGGIVMERGIVAPKYFKDKEQTDLFIGKHPGDVVVFNPWKTADGNLNELVSMLGVDKEKAEEAKGDFQFDIKEIIVLVPAEIGQEFYDNLFGADKVHNEEEYRSHIKEMIASQLKGESNFRFTIDARNVLEEQVGKLQFPAETLKESLKLQNDEVTEENVDEVYEQSSKDLEWQLIADKIAKQANIKLDDNDLKQVARMVAGQQFAKYGLTQATEEMYDRFIADMLKDDNSRRQIANDAFEMKLFNYIHENVTLDEKDVTPEEFRALFEKKD